MSSISNLLKVFFSNRAECLFQAFKKELFANSCPFSKRFIIVPSAAMKDWLLMQLAKDKDLAIAAGIEIHFLEPAISTLCAFLGPGTSVERRQEPDRLSLALAIEATIADVIKDFHNYPVSLQVQWKPLLDYLGMTTNHSISFRTAKRITALAATLAPLFIDYGSYGDQMFSQWRSATTANIHWQQLLWKSLELRYAIWNYPYRKLEAFEIEADWTPSQMQVHLFELSYLSPLHYRYFEKIARHIPVNYYLFSPCKQFWSDLLSGKEGARLKKYWMEQQIPDSQQTALDELLSEHHPLLANFGRLGREMATQIEASDPLLYEHYLITSSYSQCSDASETPDVEREETSHPLTLLEAVQGDMVLMRSPDVTDKIPFDAYDRTLQIHGAPKPMREAQVVHDTILSILDAHRHDADPITPADIVVMAPDPSVYAPFLRAVFASSDSNVRLRMLDAYPATNDTLIQGFLHLLDLSLGRWDINALFRLMEYSEFQIRHQFSPEDIRIIISWVKKAGIRWGNDSSHRNELLQRDHCRSEMVGESKYGTWEHGIGSLLEGIAMASTNETEGVFSPLDGVESIQTELLGKFLSIIRSLLIDLKPLANGSLLSLTDWSAYLRCLAEGYFSPCDRKESWKLLDAHLGSFGDVIDGLEEATYTFHSIHYHLKKGLQTEKIVYRDSNIQAVRFSSLLAMRAVPAKVIILMGMNDQTFPRTDKIQSMNLLLTSERSDYYPSQVDLDRYLFIEALFSARRYFIATYSSQLPGESGEQPPSLLIKELLNYLDSACTIPEKSPSEYCLHTHPLFPFHKSYFSSSSALKSYSQRYFSAALAHYGVNKEEPKSFLSFLVPTPQKKISGSHHIPLNDLVTFVKNPLKNYCNKGLNLYIDETSSLHEAHEDLLLSNLDKYSLVKQGVFNKKMICAVEKSEKIPFGPFKVIEVERVNNEIEQITDNLNACGVDTGSLFSIEFNERNQMAEWIASPTSCWKLPPLILRGTSCGDIRLTGHLGEVSAAGLILLAEDNLKEVVKAWPKILIFGCLINAYHLPIAPQIIFAKGKKGECKKMDFCEPEKLLTYLVDYYLKHRDLFSPLMPEWIDPILDGAPEELEKLLQEVREENEFKPVYDEYLKWLARNSLGLDLSSIVDNWQGIAQELFVDMKQAWYPKADKLKQK